MWFLFFIYIRTNGDVIKEIAKQCNGILRRLLHRLTLELIGRFLVNYMLIFDSGWCLVSAQIQFSLLKNKDWTCKTLAPHPAPPYIRWYLIFVLTPHPHLNLKMDLICVSHLNNICWLRVMVLCKLNNACFTEKI